MCAPARSSRPGRLARDLARRALSIESRLESLLSWSSGSLCAVGSPARMPAAALTVVWAHRRPAAGHRCAGAVHRVRSRASSRSAAPGGGAPSPSSPSAGSPSRQRLLSGSWWSPGRRCSRSTVGVDRVPGRSCANSGLPVRRHLAGRRRGPRDCWPWWCPGWLGLVLRAMARAQRSEVRQERPRPTPRAPSARPSRPSEIARLREEQAQAGQRRARRRRALAGGDPRAGRVGAVPSDDDPEKLKETMATIAHLGAHLAAGRSPGPHPAGHRTRRGPAAFEELVGGVRASGQEVQVAEVGTPRPLPPELEVVAHRVRAGDAHERRQARPPRPAGPCRAALARGRLGARPAHRGAATPRSRIRRRSRPSRCRPSGLLRPGPGSRGCGAGSRRRRTARRTAS